MATPPRYARILLLLPLLLVPVMGFVQRHRLLTISSGQVGIRGNLAFQITEIKPESAAAKAGLQPNDLILAIDGNKILGMDDCRKSILDPLLPIGRSFALKIARLNATAGRYEILELEVRSE